MEKAAILPLFSGFCGIPTGHLQRLSNLKKLKGPNTMYLWPFKVKIPCIRNFCSMGAFPKDVLMSVDFVIAARLS